MVDVVDKKTRSRMMSGIRGKDTQPEVMLRQSLHRLGFRYRLHVRELPGRPDIVLKKYNAAIQVHGCFWHRHIGCKFATRPTSNVRFWKSKFTKTVLRDQRNLKKLRAAGWRTAMVWECASGKKDIDKIVKRLANWLRARKRHIEIPRKAISKGAASRLRK